MLLLIVGLTTLGATLWLAYYLRVVPEGPLCPRCGERLERLDGRRSAGGERRFALPFGQRFTVAARCPSCGWDGRIRRGPEAELVRIERSERLNER